MTRAFLGNAAFLLASLPARRRFLRAQREPRRAQLEILQGYWRSNAETEFGRRHRYASLSSLEQFRDSVPVRDYEGFEPWIERIREGHQGVLTAEPVLMLEKTSGSSGPAKYIPYTHALRQEFQNAVGAWFADLYLRRPTLLGGSQYWSISPVAREQEITAGGLPVGFDDETEYLGRLEQEVMKWIQAVPSSVSRIQDVEQSRRVTLDHLMKRRDLRLISVWNPSFLTLLLDRLPPGMKPSELWPRLALISCWTSVAAARFVGDLEALFPGVEIQGKGLLSTEGVVSFPEIGRPAPSPALTSHFLEFQDEDGGFHLVDELETGRRYSVILTTGGGLVRYATHDLVEQVAPEALEFVGRGDNVSDLAGEKLSESFVAGVLEKALLEQAGSPDFSFLLLAPEWGQPPRYTLFVEAGLEVREANSGLQGGLQPTPQTSRQTSRQPNSWPATNGPQTSRQPNSWDGARTSQQPSCESNRELARAVEKGLRTSVHYDYCRRLGQLAAVEVIAVRHARSRYLDACQAKGQRLGDVKPTYLRNDLGWRQLLAPESLATLSSATQASATQASASQSPTPESSALRAAGPGGKTVGGSRS